MSILCEKACNAKYRLKISFKSFLYHTVSWFVSKFAETNWYEFVPMVHLPSWVKQLPSSTDIL